MTYIFQDQLRAYCKKHGHNWEPISTAMVKCTICGAYQYRL